jgi:DNA topoisomerase I
MGRTVEEMLLGPCPVCGSDLRIHHIRNSSQFIGCTRYPECRFNIGLPLTQWGWAIRTDTVCPTHHLNHVRLIAKGSRPWDIGCPLCHHIESNQETMVLIPSMTEEILERLQRHHIYTVHEVADAKPEALATAAAISAKSAELLKSEGEEVLGLLRLRSELRKFVRKQVPPRRGRSHSKIMKHLHANGINKIADLALADPALLKATGIGDKEVASLLKQAQEHCNDKTLRAIGVPAISLKKYYAAGIQSPEDFCRLHPVYLSIKTGISPDTTYRHAEMVCLAQNKPVPQKVTKAMLERGRAELLTIPGLGETTIEKLYSGGVIDSTTLASADPAALASHSGIPLKKVLEFQSRIPESSRAS